MKFKIGDIVRDVQSPNDVAIVVGFDDNNYIRIAWKDAEHGGSWPASDFALVRDDTPADELATVNDALQAQSETIARQAQELGAAAELLKVANERVKRYEAALVEIRALSFPLDDDAAGMYPIYKLCVEAMAETKEASKEARQVEIESETE